MPHTRMTLSEAADYLTMTEEDILSLVKQREIPHERAGSRYVFTRSEIDAWASQRLLGLKEDRLQAYHRRSSAKMHDLSKKSAIMAELLRPEWIVPALTCRTKSSIIRDMVELADRTGLLNDRELLLHNVMEREKMCSTALSGGLAILHGQHHEPYLSEDSFIVLGRTVQPIPFGSPDGRTTDMFFLVCCQDERIHLHVLARICMLCYHTPLLLTLREAEDAQAMYDAIVAVEVELIRTQS
ncbi:MAG TPA: PTS sugar transporter subunit IIA [Kiritimatiellia bacterium]|nr:PTS sugar transporter subunit IIA [Kiritimatiellia bacterium]HMO97760.1 PTS sugar transporter subunit IIA [Kiritimatiellia bacterium]HMP95399.1 PTS sugar transporter subunit IIA [Kiritimatiellia bacterium]